MIEYYQLQMSYEKMLSYETVNNIKYDYIVRCRTDTIYTKPIDFSWLDLTSDEISFRLDYIKNYFEVVSPIKLLTYFMSTIINRDLLSNIKDNVYMYDNSEFPQEHQYINKNDYWLRKYLENESIDSLKDYVKNGLYILTIRKNALYIVKRDFFSLVPSIGTFYGTLNFFQNEYWWNAESQFRSACAFSQLSIYNYDTTFEEKSLYEYDKDRYFDEEGNLKKKEMLYCLIRS